MVLSTDRTEVRAVKGVRMCNGAHVVSKTHSLSTAQRSIPNGTAGIAHVADDVTSSQTSGHLAQFRKISRYGYRTHVT
eukprot:5036009-Prymnesium_polylepis.1